MVAAIAIMNTLRSIVKYMRTLEQVFVDPDTITCGNNCVTARCRVFMREGDYLIRCFMHPKHNAPLIYGSAYYPKELGIFKIYGNIEYIDIVLLPWVEGVPLAHYIGAPDSDYAALSSSFERLALRTFDSKWMHGDIKPENIIVKPDGEMELIDYEAAWHSELKGYVYEELGTDSYRHPRRNEAFMSKHNDDFAMALIATALAALATDREAMEPYINKDKTLLDPRQVVAGVDRAMLHAQRLFAEHGDAPHYRIAKAVQSSHLAIHELRNWLNYASQPLVATLPDGGRADNERNLWGYSKDGEWLLAPLYDDCMVRDNMCRITLGEHDNFIPIEVCDEEVEADADFCG